MKKKKKTLGRASQSLNGCKEKTKRVRLFFYVLAYKYCCGLKLISVYTYRASFLSVIVVVYSIQLKSI